MSKVLCFGELLLRFSPQISGVWIKQATMPVFVGGAELNVSTSLATWQVPVSYCTALPDNYLSKEIIEVIQQRGVQTAHIILSGNRIGTYYLPQGADLKAAGVLYDRAHSSFAELKPGSVNWDEILQDVSWFHFSAISPALNGNVAAVCMQGVEAAVKKGLTVSVDLNYREKLWQWGKNPIDVMPDLVAKCDVVMGNIWAAEKMLGIQLSKNLSKEKESYLKQSIRTSEEIIKQFPKCKSVAHTFRFDADAGVQYYATLFQNAKLYIAPELHTPYTIDKVGSGDTFMAGIIWGSINKRPPQEIIDFAAAAAFNKLFITGDANTATVEEIKIRATHHA